MGTPLMTFTIGQRWISNTESQLGLGIITNLQGRQVSINFPAAEEERIYAVDNAPLSRIIYKEGEEITTTEQQKLEITAVNEHQGLLIYSGVDEAGEEHHITEISLNCFIKLNTPEKRLLSGLLDKVDAFKLRIETLNHMSRLQQSKVRGLLGSRTNHLPHQVYIASEVAQRYAPRVLLADEVGLGKTIEAGMILHYQLHTGRARKVLIVVPNTLIHQWLVEMIRRFNLYCSIIDNNRYELIDEVSSELDEEEQEEFAWTTSNNQANPFENEDLVLCSLDFLMSHKEAHQHALAVQWDLMIVDEAHHLQWSEETISPEYTYIEELAKQSKGLLLLTATPEQVGIESHFARLRLLDPSRFYDLVVFKKEEAQYKEINSLVQHLIEYQHAAPNEPLNTALYTQVKTYLGEHSSYNIEENIKNLLDRHGTGRVLFRNTRAAIKGFPERQMQSYPLPCPAIYHSLGKLQSIDPLYPEQALQENGFWLEHDPRVSWLINTINSLFPKKVLIICAKAQTAISLEQHLKLKAGIRSTAFHEGLSIIDRDRAAEYFAETENGAQALICSEIGSEGRNFQFAHHLVLFDLPLNPDLLEQRIGRLDRIGQKHSIEIHVPYLSETAQEVLFRWYHEGINLFEQSCAVGFSIYQHFASQLKPLLELHEDSAAPLNQLIKETKLYTKELNTILKEGRDKLLEMNSCNLAVAEELIAEIEAEENILELETYMTKVFQEYGIEHEHHSEHAEILRPTGHMKTSHFPGLKDDGTVVTYSRNKALVHEDIEFLSWEHPMVNETIEMTLDSEIGNATVTTISIKSIPVGTVFLETFYTINCAAPKHLQLDRFVPFTPIRILMDVNGKNLSKILDFNQLNGLCQPVKRHLGYPIIRQIQEPIESILKHSNQLAEQQMTESISQAQVEMKTHMLYELQRLQALQEINPAIRTEEITFIQDQITQNEHYMTNATLKLQAIRVVVNK
jgi:ATP-dependent helicase HepA